MTRSRARILVDCTPLRGESVLHGIGRYVYDVLHGLAETRAEWESEARIEALVDIGWVLPSPTSEDLAAVAEGAKNAPRDRDGPLIARRWVNVGRAALERRVDVLHMLQARGVPLILPVRSVVTCYDLIPLRYPNEYIGSKAGHFSRWVRDWHRYRMPSRIVAISEKTRSDLAMLGVEPSRVDVVPTGIHMDQWSPTAQPDDEARRTKHVPSGTRYLLYVGYCDHRKNVRGMMETLAKARRDEPLELVWAGDLPPPQLAAMKKLAREIGVEDSVRFLGFVADPDLAALYRGATALLFLSRLEGFGLPVAEAMASGCPSIVCRSSGSDDVAGEAGLVVDSDDIPAAADAVLKLCRSAELRANLAKLGLARVGRFDRRAMARGYVESYLRVANTRKSS